MYNNRIPDLNRRAFMKRAAAIAGLGAAAPMALNLASVGEAAAMDATDYKAIVCCFFYGGNDYANTVIPYDLPNYDLYSTIRGGAAGRKRGGVALGHSELDGTALTTVTPQTLTNGIRYALAPELTGVASLFNAGHAAIQLNVGPLVVPLTLAQYESGSKAIPSPPNCSHIMISRPSGSRSAPKAPQSAGGTHG